MHENAKESMKIKKIIVLSFVFILVIAGALIKNKEFDNNIKKIAEDFQFEKIDNRFCIKYETKLEKEISEIPYETIFKGIKSNTNYISRIISEGENGKKTTLYKTTYLAGDFIKKETIAEVVDKEPENEVVEKLERNVSNVYASRGTIVDRTQSVPNEYKEVLSMKATSYCLCQKCCGKTPSNPEYGVTASGLKIIPNTGMKVIAVDTSVIPLGTWVYVECPEGIEDYGYAIAADTGSAIKNYKIDLYVENHQEAWQWGIKNVKVYILD